MCPGLPECAQATPNASRPHQTRALPPKEAAACAVPAGTGCVTPRAGCTTKAILQMILELSSSRVTRGESGRRVSSPEPAPPSPPAAPPVGSRRVSNGWGEDGRTKVLQGKDSTRGYAAPDQQTQACGARRTVWPGVLGAPHPGSGLVPHLWVRAARLGPRKLGGCRATSSMRGPLQGLPPQWCPRGRTASPRANPGITLLHEGQAPPAQPELKDTLWRSTRVLGRCDRKLCEQEGGPTDGGRWWVRCEPEGQSPPTFWPHPSRPDTNVSCTQPLRPPRPPGCARA